MSTIPMPTSQQTVGPFFPGSFVRAGDNDLTRITPEAAPTRLGEAILLRGQVTQEGGIPCQNAILEAWQADAGGRFRHPLDPEAQLADPDFLGWGRTSTDAAGRFEFRTVMPGGYAEGVGRRAPHVNLTAMASGLMRRVQTTMFFPDHAAGNAADPVLTLLPEARRGRLVARSDGMAGGVRVFRFDFRLRGGPEEETPFFAE